MKCPLTPILVSALLGGCATLPGSDAQPAQQRLLSAAPSCVTPHQCEAMWAAARRWMINTCRYPIRTETDRLLETYNTADDNTVPRRVSSALACSVTKMPRSEGGYSFVVVAACSAVVPPVAPCYPPVGESIARFDKSLTAVAARVKD
jgi:hypothetical protein